VEDFGGRLGGVNVVTARALRETTRRARAEQASSNPAEDTSHEISEERTACYRQSR
jgi:hypothetical protein